MVLWSLGDYQQARQLQDDTVTRSRRVLGEDNSVTLLPAIFLASPWDRRASTSRPASSITTPSPEGAASSARTTPTRCARPASSARSWAHWASTSRPATSRTPPSPATAGCWARTTPKPSPRPAGSRADLRELGEYQQAHALDEDTLARPRRVLGDDHPDTLTSANNLAPDLSALGEHQQARNLDEDTLARRRRVLGEDHPATQQSEQNLAEVLRKLNEADRS